MKMQLMKILMVCALVVGGGALMWQYEHRWSEDAKKAEEIRKLKEQNDQLESFVSRLTSEKRVAEVVVCGQKKSGSVVEETTLMFVEYGGDGKQLPPRYFTIKGNVAHIDALVIKFEQDFIKKGDPLRGHSMVLFHRLYGDYQAPADGYMIDMPGKPPEVYRIPTRSPAASEFESQMWQNFWKLADDEQYRKEKGVRVAMGESPWTRFYPDKVYTLTLQADGGLSLSARAMDGIWKEYRDALARARGSVSAVGR
ncbi:MAG TPA: hypothetical protein VGQ99_22640 [Tepidisphaeraceae bacterium]|jgi:hypothetical protein|nr:hypothetical protein [Tepidisphaeraceae bacterium]